MDGSLFSRIVAQLANMPAVWMFLSLGCLVLSVALVVLRRTRWGQSRPMRKCAALSLLAHVLLAGLATTVKIVAGTNIHVIPAAVQVNLVDPQAASEDEPAAASQVQPWQQLAADSGPGPKMPEFDRPAPPAEGDPQEDSLMRPMEVSEDNLASTPESPDEELDLTQAADQLLGDRARSSSPAEPIDAPQAQRRETVELTIPVPPLRRSQHATRSSDPQSDAPQVAESGADGERSSNVESWQTLESEPETSQSALRDAGDRSLIPPQPFIADLEKRDTSKPVVPGSDESNASGDPLDAHDRTAAQGGASQAQNAQSRVYRNRLALNRSEIAVKNGGSWKTEAAVQAALKWLAANQGKDGNWDADQHGAGREHAVLGHDRRGAGMNADTGISGLALLAFLGAGNTHRRGEYKTTVGRGIDYLVQVQAADGNLAGNATLFARMYCHGMGTFALSEAYAMTGDERLLEPVTRAVQYSIAAQRPDTGGWRYRPGDTGDTSQLGWQVMALKSAKWAGVDVPDDVFRRIRLYLRTVDAGRHGGLASYRPQSHVNRPMTAEALVCRQLTDIGPARATYQEAADYLMGELPGHEQPNLYYWYYATLGLYQQGGDDWQRWNAALKPVLIEAQQTTGPAAGSWDTDTVWGGYGGRVYTTAMAALCLEVYYRYLPLYEQVARGRQSQSRR